MSGRILGVDYGQRRIGLALSDPTATIASPLGTLTRRAGKRPPWAELMRLVEEHEVDELVIGLPLDLRGDEGEWAAGVRAFGEQLGRRTDLVVHWIDERMSSVMAERAVRELGLRRRQREDKTRIDAAAAAVLLQRYLQQRRNETTRDPL
jgi:putative holliday junction resolvase